MFVSCPEISNMYFLNRFETNCGKLMIPFHAIWGLCWYIFFWIFSQGGQELSEGMSTLMLPKVVCGR